MTDAMKMGVETKKLEVYCPVCNCGVGFALTEASVLVKFLEHMQRKHPLHCSCGILLEGHRRCRACGIYLGSGHLEVASEIRQGNTFCHDCAKFYDKDPAEIRQYHFGPFKVGKELILERGLELGQISHDESACLNQTNASHKIYQQSGVDTI